MEVLIFFLQPSSREWNYVDAAEKRRILQNSTEDGEFWWDFKTKTEKWTT